MATQDSPNFFRLPGEEVGEGGLSDRAFRNVVVDGGLTELLPCRAGQDEGAADEVRRAVLLGHSCVGTLERTSVLRVLA